MSGADEQKAGPFEDLEWTAELEARAAAPGPRPLLHGYDVQGDLAQHYRFGELALLALTGEPPTADLGRAFEVALVFASATHVGEAPVHATVLARLCGADTSGALASGAIALAEQARFGLDEQREVLAWLAEGTGPPPPAASAQDDDERAAVARLAAALAPTAVCVPLLAAAPSLAAALVAVFHACGLCRRGQLEAAFVLARLPVVAAELLATRAGDFASYPANLPPVAYRAPAEPAKEGS